MEQVSSVEVILNDLDLNPKCPHGPTILFKRLSKDREQKFYACSACRDNKDCSFYHRFEEEWSGEKESVWRSRTCDVLPKIDHFLLSERFQKIHKLLPQERNYCHTCDFLLFPSELNMHNSHELQSDISDYHLTHPSEIMKPRESSKKEAQYLFSRKSVNDIVKMVRSAGIRRVLCIGSPRIHEHVCSKYTDDMTSLLLDFDHRYHQFFKEFVWFNVFNCHWFAGEKGKSSTLQFMEEGPAHQLAIITDPPFGGRVEPLIHTFLKLDKMHAKLHPELSAPLSLFWIFPYFMETTLTATCSTMEMLDYKVEYDNHPLFHQGLKGRKYGSPVRIFTNISPDKLPLPEEDGYWYCKSCSRWSSKENKHCLKCNCCSSKNGSTYVHCDKCSRCVKPSWRHCDTCNRCCVQDHKCGKSQALVCFSCHKPNHKKYDCPNHKYSQDGYNANRKRNKPGKRKTVDLEIEAKSFSSKRFKRSSLMLPQAQ